MQARTRQTCLRAVVALGLVALAAGPTLAQPGSATNIGTWKLNVAKSRYVAGMAAKSATMTIEAAGAGVKIAVASVAPDGTASHWETVGNYDGKDVPIVGDASGPEMVVLTRVDANTTRSIYKRGGKVTVTQTAVVSTDGKTLTITSTGANFQGKAVNTVTVYEKQ